VYYDVPWSVDILFMFAFITMMVTIAAAVFDIKDIEGDRAEGIRTVPLVLGVDRTRRLAAAASAVVGLGVGGLLLAGILSARYAVLLGFVAYVAGYSFLARRDRTPLFTGSSPMSNTDCSRSCCSQSSWPGEPGPDSTVR